MDQDHNQNDQHEHDQNDKTESSHQHPRKQSRFSNVISGVIGGVIAAIIVSLLFTSEVFPFDKAEEDNNASSDQSDNPPITETVTSDTNISADLDELSNAIVGVVSLQQQDVWTPNEEAGAGSGIIYKTEGDKAYIVTNNHVVQGAEEVEVDLSSEERIEANILGTDELSDLAVLEIDSSQVEHVADLGDSSKLEVGESVIAIGNPLGMDFAGSVTKGIISGLDRSIEVDTTGNNQTDWVTEVIQTDAAINPGNSGGALVNPNGEVVGINSMKIAQQAVEGISFAIPINTALPIIEQLEEDGEIARPFIGISTAEINHVPPEYKDKVSLPEDIDGGMVVAEVQQQSPAADAGIQQFDVITKINDQEVETLLDLRKYMYSETSIGDTIEIEIYRDGKKQTIELKLTERED